LTVQGGLGEFVISGSLDPPYGKILTEFLRFAWTQLVSSSGVPTPGPPPGQLCCWYYRI